MHGLRQVPGISQVKVSFGGEGVLPGGVFLLSLIMAFVLLSFTLTVFMEIEFPLK